MKRRIVVLLGAFFICCLSVNLCLNFAKAEEGPLNVKKTNSEITFYLKSGEIIKGNLIEKTDEEIVIEKYGTRLSLKLAEILRIEENATGKAFPASYKLPFSTAVITYEYKGYETGKETVYIDADKSKIVTESSIIINIDGFADEDNNLVIYDGNAMYMVDLDKSEAIKMEIEGDIISEIFNERLYFGRPIKLETILGKECKVYQNSMGNFYFWHGILLKEEITNLYTGKRLSSVKEVIDIQLDVAISPNKFELPKNIQVKTWEDMWVDFDKSTEEMQKEAEKWEQESTEQYKESLLEQAKEEPEIGKILEEATRDDDTLDIGKLGQLMEEKREKDLIEEAKGLEGGEKLIKEATDENGKIDTPKLSQAVWGKKDEIRKKENEVSKKYYKLIEAANLYRSQEIYQRALDKYTEAIKLNPSDSSGYFHRFILYTTMDEYEKAIEDITSYVEIVGMDQGFDYFIWKADLLAWLGRYKDAIDEYTKCVDMFGKQSEEKISQEIEKNKVLLGEIGDDESNIDWSRISDSGENRLAEIIKKRGEAYGKMGENKKALLDFAKAIEKSRDEKTKGDVYFSRGLVYRQMNEISKMQDDWEKAQSLGDKLEEGVRKLFGGRHGRHIWYYVDGTVKTQGNYVDGKKHGYFRWYYPNGSIKTEGEYVNGVEQGEWKWYNKDGQLSKRAVYEKGVIQKN